MSTIFLAVEIYWIYIGFLYWCNLIDETDVELQEFWFESNYNLVQGYSNDNKSNWHIYLIKTIGFDLITGKFWFMANVVYDKVFLQVMKHKDIIHLN